MSANILKSTFYSAFIQQMHQGTEFSEFLPEIASLSSILQTRGAAAAAAAAELAKKNADITSLVAQLSRVCVCV
jgi:hypothetical protein